MFLAILIPFAVTFGLTLFGRARFLSAYERAQGKTPAEAITGAELAREILEKADAGVVEVVVGKGLFADHYDPETKRLFLAKRHFYGSTCAALGIAAHVAGHAMQHRADFRPLFWRLSAIKTTTYFILPLAVLAAGTIVTPFMGKSGLIIALAIWTLINAYNLLTLPAEVDATERARVVVERLRHFRGPGERAGVERMMKAASATYVDGFFRTLSWLASLVVPKLKSL